MGKISPISAKYIVNSSIDIEGVVDRPDVIGAIFGQTEGLLGADLELRELQRSGRIGRIEVNTESKGGKTHGTIVIPSSLDKAETAIVGAALEVIQRIGPCNAKIKVHQIEDVRVSKRALVISRAKQLLKNLIDNSMPDSQELADEVAHSVRVMEVTTYGREKLPAGPGVEDGDEIIIVEGRADVINLLKHGIKNAIAINGTSVPKSIIELCSKRVVTVFVDGDRGGDLIIRELLAVVDVDFVTKAPNGMEVEEITKKEIYKALRSKVSPEQAKTAISKRTDNIAMENTRIKGAAFARGSTPQRRTGNFQQRGPSSTRAPQRSTQRAPARAPTRAPARAPTRAAPRASSGKLSDDQKASFGKMLEDLIGTRGAYLLDNKSNILGKVPFTELVTTIKSLSSGIYAVVFDGVVEEDLMTVAGQAGVKYLIGMGSKVKGGSVQVLTAETLA